MPPCSYARCANGQPPSTHIIRKQDGTFFASCDDCIEPMMHAVKLQGIDAQVISLEALGMLNRASKPSPEPTPVVSCCPPGHEGALGPPGV